jgi:hypothetical protein
MVAQRRPPPHHRPRESDYPAQPVGQSPAALPNHGCREGNTVHNVSRPAGKLRHRCPTVLGQKGDSPRQVICLSRPLDLCQRSSDGPEQVVTLNQQLYLSMNSVTRSLD